MKLSDAETQELIELVGKCHRDADDSFLEQTQIESPFPKQRGALLSNPWPIYQEFFEGKHWQRMGKMPAWKSCPVDNRVFAICEGMTTFLTDNRAKAQFMPVETDDAALANKVQATWNLWCSQVGYDAQTPLAVLDSRKFGGGWLTLKRDKAAPLGQRLEMVHPDMVRVDPDCTAADYLSGKGPSYLIYEYMAPFGDLKAQFTEVDFDNDFDPKWMLNQGTSFFDRVARAVGINSNATNHAVTVPVYELWIRDNATIVFEEELGESVVVKRKPKYKGGRRIIVSGGKLLVDEKNPYKHGGFPFIPILAYPETSKFYCAGDVQNIIGPQVTLNRYHQLTYDTTVKAGGGLLLVDPRAGLTADMITNDPFQIVEVTGLDVNRALRFEKFPAPSRHITEQISVLGKVIDDAAGMHDISRGTYTPGNKTAQEIAALTESDKTRVRKAARWLAWANEQIARQWLSNAAQWPGWEVFVRIAGDTDTEETLVSMAGDDLKSRDENGDLSSAMKFDVLIADSSTLPTYFQERKQMALDLFDRQVIDPEALLQMLEFPGWRAIVARMNAQAPPPPDPMAGGGDPMMAQEMPQEMPPPDMASPEDDMMQAVQEVAAQTGLPVEQVMAMVMQGEGGM